MVKMIRCPSPDTIASYLTKTIGSKLAENHVCHFDKCTIENLKVEIHQNPMDKVFGIRTKYIKVPKWINNQTLVKNIYSIYVCNNTGKIHYCHQACDGDRMANADNCRVCCISGIQYAAESVRSWKMSSRCIPTVTANKQDPYMYSRDNDGRVKLSGIHNLKITQCIMISNEFLSKLLFSNKRMRNERHKLNENKKDAEKIVNKYKRHCERFKKPKIFVHMATMYITRMNKKPLCTQLLCKTELEKEELIFRYTKEMIGYWKMIVYRTTLGRTSPSLFPFKSFEWK